MQTKLARITTVPLSIRVLLNGQERYFSDRGFQVLLASGPGERMTDSGMRIEVLPLSRELSLWKDLYALWKTWRWLKAVHPDILHTHTPKAGLIGMIAGYFAGIPIRLHTVAGLPEMELNGLLKILLRLTERTTALFATRLYPNSNGLMQYMDTERLAPSRKMRVIGNGSSNGIDLEYYARSTEIATQASELRKKYDILQGDIVFVFVGRLDNHKGLRELRTAFEKVIEMHGNSWLILVGAVETAREGLDVKTLSWFQEFDHVVMAGFQNDVRPWLLAADIVVFPSYREGFPNVPLQAGAMGLPVIATDIIGCNEVVKHRVNGLLVPKKDPDALASAMTYLIRNANRRVLMGKAGRKLVADRFEQQWFWRELETEYNSFLSEGSINTVK